jgi:hypothetical protein
LLTYTGVRFRGEDHPSSAATPSISDSFHQSGDDT